jgi:hypothetical protein
MTVRHRHAFLDFIAIFALASWSEDAGAQANALIDPLGLIEPAGSCIERPLAPRSHRADAAHRLHELACAKPAGPERSPHRPRRDEVRFRAPHLRRPVGDGEAAIQDGPRPALD